MTYRMHGGARQALYLAGALLCLLVFAIPFAIWFFVAAARGRVEMTEDTLVARGFWTTRIRLAEVKRLGLLQVPIVARGIGGRIARRKVGGPVAVHLCAMDARGKTRKIMASMFENHQDFINRTSQAVRLPLETVGLGNFGVKWSAREA